MATAVRTALDAKIKMGQRPTALRIDRTLGQLPDIEAMHKTHEMMELKEQVAELKAQGIRATVVIEYES